MKTPKKPNLKNTATKPMSSKKTSDEEDDDDEEEYEQE